MFTKFISWLNDFTKFEKINFSQIKRDSLRQAEPGWERYEIIKNYHKALAPYFYWTLSIILYFIVGLVVGRNISDFYIPFDFSTIYLSFFAIIAILLIFTYEKPGSLTYSFRYRMLFSADVIMFTFAILFIPNLFEDVLFIGMYTLLLARMNLVYFLSSDNLENTLIKKDNFTLKKTKVNKLLLIYYKLSPYIYCITLGLLLIDHIRIINFYGIDLFISQNSHQVFLLAFIISSPFMFVYDYILSRKKVNYYKNRVLSLLATYIIIMEFALASPNHILWLQEMPTANYNHIPLIVILLISVFGFYPISKRIPKKSHS